MENIKRSFKKDTILLIYRCGSYAFGTSNENSDEDYVVVLQNFNGLTHLTEGKKEYFIFGLEAWKDKQEFSDEYAEYYEIFNDEVLSFPDSIIYLDDSISELVRKYQIEFKDKYKIWLNKVISHFEFYLNLKIINKQMYHLIRIKHIIENYKVSGSFSLDLSKEVLSFIDKYKRENDKSKYKKEIEEAFIYLKNEGGIEL